MCSYEEFNAEAEEIIDLGNGVGFSVDIYRGRPVGSSAEVRFRCATVAMQAEGLIERTLRRQQRGPRRRRTSPRGTGRMKVKGAWTKFLLCERVASGAGDDELKRRVRD
jgi:hypothetical protein